MLTILFDGIAYGMVLFVLGCGLSVTMGLMNFVNLAHGAFAMLGGYVAVLAMQRLGLPFLASLPLAFLSAALVGIVLERLIYRPMYAKSHLDQVMFSIGLVFMAVAGTDWLMGSTQQFIRLPAWLQGRFEIAGIGIGRYRLFVIAICGLLAVSLQWGFTRTRFGSRLRAAVDDARVARGLGIPVNRLFALTFALGCGLAGLGGALGIELMGLDPTFPLKFMIYFLIVVTVGGTSSITGPFFAAMLLGVADVVGKYLVPQVGAFIIYALMVGLLITRPHGLFAEGAGMSAESFEARVRQALYAGRRWNPAEIGFWILAFAAYLLFPSHLLLLNEIAILALFALSLDLILGYAGIVSLGHAAFLGMGAYAAGIFAKYVTGDPLAGLFVGMAAAGLLGLLTSPLVLRGSDLTRLMVTLGVALILYELANSFGSLTGGADGLQGVMIKPVLGQFELDIFGRTAYLYSLSVLFLLFLIARRVVHSPFGLSLRAVRDNPLRASASGVPNGRRLAAAYTLAAAYAGAAGALLAQTTQFVSLDVLDFHRSADLMLVLIIGGAGYLYGGLVGAIAFKLLQDAIASFTPQYWMFWIGLFLVLFVLGGREIIHGAVKTVAGRFARLGRGGAR